MAKHLSVRLPWHDRGWDGYVCDRPSANVFCTGEYGLKAHGIREGKKDDKEEDLRSQPCSSLRAGDYRPPCLRTIQTFGGTATLPYQHEPKSFLSTPENPVRAVDDAIKPFTVGTWAYDQVFRREEADDETPAEFADRYSPEEAQRNISDFFGDLAAPSSLVFFYLNYDNPLNSERRRYVLVGAAEVDAVSGQHEWEGMERTLSLAKARDAAEDARAKIRNGGDPVGERQAAREIPTDNVDALVKEYVMKHVRVKMRSCAEEERVLNVDVLPFWKDRSVRELTRRDVRALVAPIVDRGSPIMANRVLAVVRRMLNYGVRNDWLDANPASLIDKPGNEVSRERVLTDDEIRRLWRLLSRQPTTAERAAPGRKR